MRTRSVVPKLRLAAAAIMAAATAVPAGPASAAEYNVSGSDTLFEILTDSFAQWKIDTASADTLLYVGGGSGTGENALTRKCTDTTKVCPSQGFAGMSRNFKSNFIGDPTAVPVVNPPAPYGTITLIPGMANVVGLDAAVVIERALSPIYPNVQFATTPPANNKAAVDNIVALLLGGKSLQPARCSGNNAACDYTAIPDPCVAANQGSCIIGAEGTLEACTHPARLQAIADFQAGYFDGTISLDHFLRRDDNSGTTDTFKERFRIKRFCNDAAKPPSPRPYRCSVATGGNAAGKLCLPWSSTGATLCGAGEGTCQKEAWMCKNARTACTPIAAETGTGCPYNTTIGGNSAYCATCGAGDTCIKANLNYFAPDRDPIRTQCLPATGTQGITSCTDSVTGLPCGAVCSGSGAYCRVGVVGDCPAGQSCAVPATCAQGFVVSISDEDAGMPNETLTIGNRVGSPDTTYYNGHVIGFAGRAAVDQLASKSATAPTLRGFPATDDGLVRLGTYFMSRRLFVNSATSSTLGDGAKDVSGAALARNAADTSFMAWATIRVNVDDIVKKNGFVPCTGDYSDPVAPNICAAVPFPAADVINSCTKNAGAACAGADVCCTRGA